MWGIAGIWESVKKTGEIGSTPRSEYVCEPECTCTEWVCLVIVSLCTVGTPVHCVCSYSVYTWACVVWVCLCPVWAPMGCRCACAPGVPIHVSAWMGLGALAVLFRGSVSSSLRFQRKKKTVHMGGGERNTRAVVLDSVRAVGFPLHSPSSPNTDTYNPSSE